jgi:hypothetical protein
LVKLKLPTFETHHQTITNNFYSRSTNAATESFNAKIKDFKRQFRGVVDVKFFLFRLCNIYAWTQGCGYDPKYALEDNTKKAFANLSFTKALK